MTLWTKETDSILLTLQSEALSNTLFLCLHYFIKLLQLLSLYSTIPLPVLDFFSQEQEAEENQRKIDFQCSSDCTCTGRFGSGHSAVSAAVWQAGCVFAAAEEEKRLFLGKFIPSSAVRHNIETQTETLCLFKSKMQITTGRSILLITFYIVCCTPAYMF